MRSTSHKKNFIARLHIILRGLIITEAVGDFLSVKCLSKPPKYCLSLIPKTVIKSCSRGCTTVEFGSTSWVNKPKLHHSPPSYCMCVASAPLAEVMNVQFLKGPLGVTDYTLYWVREQGSIVLAVFRVWNVLLDTKQTEQCLQGWFPVSWRSLLRLPCPGLVCSLLMN